MFLAPKGIVLMETYEIKFATMLTPMIKINPQRGVMGARKALYLFPSAFFLVVGLNSCTNLSQYGFNAIGGSITPIKELKAQKDGATVYVQGKVEKSVPLLQQQRVYQINDSSGKIWVLSKRTDIKEQDQVTFSGILKYKSIPLGGKELGEIYLEEK